VLPGGGLTNCRG